MEKLESIKQKIYSEKYPKEVQDYLDNFCMSIISVLCYNDSNQNDLNLGIELSKNKEKEIYRFQYLFVESKIEEEKEACISKQAILNHNNPNFKKFNHLNENKLKNAVINKRNMRFYNMQLLFSNPKNYIELNDDDISTNKENSLIDYINISPDKIPDNLLIKLGLVGENYEELLKQLKQTRKKLDRGLLILEINKQKIEAIQNLKQEFKNLSPLKVSSRKDSTRIMTINTGKNAGKIILTQSPELFNKNKKGAGNLDMNKNIYVFDDIFSLFRSQIYALKNIEENIQTIKSNKDKSSELSQNWRYINTDNLKIEVEKITEELEGYNTYFESKVVNSRIPKINYKNPITDSSVMHGVNNDLEKGFLKLNANKGVISSQVEIINEEITNQIKKYRIFLKNFTDFINTLKQEELTKVINSNNDKDNEMCFKENEESFRLFVRQINTFLMGGSSNIANPFKDFYTELLTVQKNVNSAIKQKNSITILRKILTVNLLIKLKIFEIYEYSLLNNIKLDEGFLENNHKLILILDKYKTLLTNKNFLGSFKIGPGIDGKYNDALEKIEKLKKEQNSK